MGFPPFLPRASTVPLGIHAGPNAPLLSCCQQSQMLSSFYFYFYIFFSLTYSIFTFGGCPSPACPAVPVGDGPDPACSPSSFPPASPWSRPGRPRGRAVTSRVLVVGLRVQDPGPVWPLHGVHQLPPASHSPARCCVCAVCMLHARPGRLPSPRTLPAGCLAPCPSRSTERRGLGCVPSSVPKALLAGLAAGGDREDGVAPSRWSRALVRSPRAPVWVLILGVGLWGAWPGHGSCSVGPVGVGSQRCLLGWWWGATGASAMVLVLLVPAQTICGAWARLVFARLRCLAVHNESFWSPVAAKLLQQSLQHQEGAQVGLVLLGHRGDRHAGLVCPILPQAAARLHGDRLALHQVLHVLLRGHRHG